MDSEYTPLIIFAVVVPIFWAVATYNKFIKYRNMIEESWSGIDVALKQRFNLIPNLVHAVRMYSSHEADLLNEVTEKRIGSSDMDERMSEESEVSQSIKGLLAVAESYPELRASENYSVLQHNLGEVEKEIAVARRQFNASVRKLNTLVQSFPSNLIAGIFRFREARYFSLELATERANPDLSQQ